MPAAIGIEAQAVNGTTKRRRKIHLYILLIEQNGIAVRTHRFIVIGIARNSGDGIRQVVQRTETKSICSAMRGQQQGQSVHQLRSIVGSYRTHAQHTIGQMHSGKSGNEQMTDIAHIRIHVVHRPLKYVGLDIIFTSGRA
ncbi:hypothetical protein HMPREF1555_01877 [Porphyromonas gingivalis F0570]|uniref:Uncharacterized protein n=1 Tax=Porphyromonas gingivalis F0570 TaxID=1227271 RepID=A0A0E2LP53_PORGN|nr:hypothetical protein HMPREF1555_01877 [Porphyromonas gingivalis F0570]